MELDEADSLFEGMVLFSRSELDANLPEEPAIEARFEAKVVKDEHDAGGKTGDIKATNNNAHQPLDENLFSDLTLIHPDDLVSVDVENSDVLQTDSATSKRKRRVVSRRIGYARDTLPSSPGTAGTKASPVVTFPSSQSDCEPLVSTINVEKQESASISSRMEESSTTVLRTKASCPAPITSEDSIATASLAAEDSVTTCLGTEDSSISGKTPDFIKESPLEHLRSQAASDVARARKQCSSVSASLKESIRRRRRIEEDLSTASADHHLLETELQDACEREDFDSAQKISDSLAASEDHRRILLESFQNEKVIGDAMDSQMNEALLGLIAVEEHCATLFRSHAQDIEQTGKVFLSTSKERFSKEMDTWFSSSEAIHGTDIALGIEMYCIDEVRSTLTDSIQQATEVDQREKDSLCKKKESLAAELQDLLALAKRKEEEIAETDFKIKHIDEKIANAVDDFQQIQLVIDFKHEKLQSAISDIHMQSKTLSNSKSVIDNMVVQDQTEVSKLNDLILASEEEAKSYEEVVKQRKSLHVAVSKSREQKAKLADFEEKLIRQVQELQHEVVAARASLQELTSMKSSIRQKVSSYNQRLFFIDKRIPELEAEKRVAAAARNFGDAARITADAKSLNIEKEGLLADLEKETTKLNSLEQTVKDTASKLLVNEELMHAKEKEVALARFQMLGLSVATAKAERFAALELGDTEEADLLLGEIEVATSESMDLETKYGFKEENAANLPTQSLSLELVANLGKEELLRLTDFVDRSSSLH